MTQPTCLHDLLWFMVSCLSQSTCEIDDELQNVHDSPNHSADRDRKDNEQVRLQDQTTGSELCHREI